MDDLIIQFFYFIFSLNQKFKDKIFNYKLVPTAEMKQKN